ncbi:DUF389 domain-containing protein [Demequina sp. NBRC 110053]|uniref:DUF389 domain-containing protein n=1 Tax=Demequina sp. NBRC 110053 TaxID=1570342 RepID=UPI001F252237|nr:DUF389 domain-containing protein [Demequina sp. NBRC 110053]
MRRDVLFEHDDNVKRYSKFWALMILSSALAAAGILTESLPALIGAMIISPFITPMTGVMLATVLTQRRNTLRSVALVLAGAASAVGVSVLIGLLTGSEVSAATNPLVADRVTSDMFDLVVGLLTGVVAAIALVRDDISNSVPGVAIAVTLVPALAVAGLTLQSGQHAQAWDALVLFGANAVATLATGTVTMAVLGVRASLTLGEPAGSASEGVPRDDPRHGDESTWSRVVALSAVALVIAAPLAISAVHLRAEQTTQDTVDGTSRAWAESVGVEYIGMDASGPDLVVNFEGSQPLPSPGGLADALEAAGIDTTAVVAKLVPVETHRLGDLAGN